MPSHSGGSSAIDGALPMIQQVLDEAPSIIMDGADFLFLWWQIEIEDNAASRFIHNKTAATRPSPIERLLKTDLVTVLSVYYLYYSNTNQYNLDISNNFDFTIISLYAQSKDSTYTLHTPYDFLLYFAIESNVPPPS